MRRRLVLLLVLALAATSCDYREFLRIDPDGSAELRIEIEVQRSDQPDGIWPVMLDWDAADEIRTMFDDAPRQFLVELFALEGTEPWIDDAVEGLVFDMNASGLRMEVDWEIDDLRTAASDETVFERSIILTDAEVTEADDGSISLSAPARDSAAALVSSYFALEDDPFVATDRGDSSPVTISVEVVVPGDPLRSDAHERIDSRHLWRWDFGRDGEPGLQVSWDPDTDDGCELCGLFAPLVILIVALFGILALGVLAASLGLLEAWRVTRRDRRDTS